MIETGYTLRWRKRWDQNLHKTVQGRELYAFRSWLIDAAAFAPTKVWIPGAGNVECDRGELVTSTLRLASEFSVDRRRIRTWLDNLAEMEFLTYTATNRMTRIILTNYNAYQEIPKQTDQQTAQRQTSRRPATDQPLKIKKVNEVKEDIQEIAASPSPPISILGIQKTKTPKLIPDDLALTPEMISHATSLEIKDVRRVFEAFKAHHANKGTKGLSWGQGWITWCSNETKFKGGNGGAPRKTFDELAREKGKRDAQIFLDRHKEIDHERD